MVRPLRIEYPGAFYHVTSRGNERKAIFRSRGDREQFLGYLESTTDRYGALIHAYCLMGNHYHLFIETPLGNLSRIMQHINGAYTMYFNTKRKRSGHLFQGRYKAILVEADEYATALSRYIHLNPVRAGLEPAPAAYEWSSYQYYTIKPKAPEWLQRGFILGYFHEDKKKAMKLYRAFVEPILEEEPLNPLSQQLHSVILGSQDFVEAVKSAFVSGRRPDRDLPDLNVIQKRIGIEEIEQAVDRVLGFDLKLARQVKLYFSHRYTGLKLKAIGNRFGISESGVTQASRRILLRAQTDKRISKVIDKVAKIVNV
ncbi:MAG: transposase [Desulfosarcinaceae bacterium]